MRKHVIQALLVGGAAVATIALGTSQSFAAGSVVSITNGNVSFTANGDGATVLTDITDAQTVTCATSTSSGSVGNATNAPVPYTVLDSSGANTGAITGLTFTSCTSSFGNTSVTTNPPLDLIITGFNASNQAVGVVQNHLGSSTDLATVTVLTCSFGVSGSAPVTWVNGTVDQLQVSPTAGPPNTLTTDNVSGGCLGQISTGAVLQFTGNYTVNPANITVS